MKYEIKIEILVNSDIDRSLSNVLDYLTDQIDVYDLKRLHVNDTIVFNSDGAVVYIRRTC